MQTVTGRIFFFFPTVLISKMADGFSHHASHTHHNEAETEGRTSKRDKSTVLPDNVLSFC